MGLDSRTLWKATTCSKRPWWLPFCSHYVCNKFKQAHKNRGKIHLGCGSSPGRSESFTRFSSEVLRSQPGLPARHKSSLQTQTGDMANGLGISLKGLHKPLCTAARALTGGSTQQLLGGVSDPNTKISPQAPELCAGSCCRVGQLLWLSQCLGCSLGLTKAENLSPSLAQSCFLTSSEDRTRVPQFPHLLQEPSSALKSLTVKLIPHVRPKYHCNVIIIISFIKRGFFFCTESLPCWLAGGRARGALLTPLLFQVPGLTPPSCTIFLLGMEHKERGKHRGTGPLMCSTQTNPVELAPSPLPLPLCSRDLSLARPIFSMAFWG